MTSNRRIFLNIVATYGRSLFALVCGLFTARWILQALGHVDYGLYGVVGGLTIIISFFNGVLATAIGRFYAFSLGQAKTAASYEEGLDNCRAWFNTAFSLHTLVPLILVVIGYPIGEWMVRHFLTIPADRIEPCVWVFRFACLSCFIGMVNAPFQGMYVAKQYIAELTIYGFCQTTVNVCFMYYMVMHPGDWLTRYAAWACFVSIAPQIIICVRALRVFPECKIMPRYFFKFERIKELGTFTFWQTFGLLGHVFKSQGVALVVNKYFGPSVNAAMTVANQVNAHTTSLVSAMQGAFTPAITQAYGAGDIEQVRRMSYRTCKFGTLLVLVFAIPLSLELPEIMRLWLKNPPEYAVGLCWCMLLMLVIDKSGLGQMIAIYATGKIAGYQVVSGGALALTLPISWILAAIGCGVYSIGASLVLSMLLCVLGRIWYARKFIQMSARRWLRFVVVPIAVVTGVVALIGALPRFVMSASFLRICLTTVVCEIIFMPLVWFFVLDVAERLVVSSSIVKMASSIRGRFG